LRHGPSCPFFFELTFSPEAVLSCLFPPAAGLEQNAEHRPGEAERRPGPAWKRERNRERAGKESFERRKFHLFVSPPYRNHCCCPRARRRRAQRAQRAPGRGRAGHVCEWGRAKDGSERGRLRAGRREREKGRKRRKEFLKRRAKGGKITLLLFFFNLNLHLRLHSTPPPLSRSPSIRTAAFSSFLNSTFLSLFFCSLLQVRVVDRAVLISFRFSFSFSFLFFFFSSYVFSSLLFFSSTPLLLLYFSSSTSPRPAPTQTKPRPAPVPPAPP